MRKTYDEHVTLSRFLVMMEEVGRRCPILQTSSTIPVEGK